MAWTELRTGSGALVGRVDHDRMLIEFWDRRARAPFVVDLSEAAIMYAAMEIARRKHRAAILAGLEGQGVASEG